jgi:hypothetical protein
MSTTEPAVDQIQELLKRVSVLEAGLAALKGHISIGANKPPALPDIPTTTTDQRLSKPALAKRWGVSCRSVDRRREEPGFPEPEIVSARPYWWLSAIIRFERACAASAASEVPPA